MSIYLGQLGRMVELKCPASQQLSLDDATTFKSTLGGRRIAQVPPVVGHRSWQCQLSDASTPDQVGTVMAFINREWGTGPFVFVSADAPVTNMLTPAESSCDPRSRPPGTTGGTGGPMVIEGGMAGRSWINNNPAALLPLSDHYSPVLPGGRVTISAFLNGPNPRLVAYFYDATGTIISSPMAPNAKESWVGKRFSFSVNVPTGAVSCRIRAVGVSQAARPALTWSDSMLDWADGQGCPKAVIHGPSRDLTMASRDLRGGRYSNLSFTITGVG